MNWSLTLGSISGIRIRIHLTFLVLLVWIGIAFWHTGGPAAAAHGLVYILLLFLCVVLHEFGHIFTARRFGGETLDVILLPIGGVARMKHMPEKPGQELLVALAGPCVNLVIAAVLIALIGPARLEHDLVQPPESIPIVAQLVVANLVLAVFNLIPAFPMDGGRALRAMLSYRMGRVAATALAARIGHVLAIGFGVYGFLSGLPLLMFVALFIYFGASAENGETQIRSFAHQLKLSDAMITQFSTLSVTSRVGEAVALLTHSAQHDIPIVDGVGKVVGLLTRDRILKALHDQGRDAPVAELMQVDCPTILAQADLDHALRLIEEQRLPALVVTDRAGHPVGMVTLENLGQFLMLARLQQQR